MIKVGFKRLTGDAILPVKAHPTDSGFDLFANEDAIIEPGQTVVIKTGVAVKLPPGYEAQVRPRSGVTSKTKLRVQLGTIDNDYTGEIGIIVDNININHYIPIMDVTNEYVVDIETDLTIFGNTIDGEIIHVPNHPEGTYVIQKGDKLAQL